MSGLVKAAAQGIERIKQFLGGACVEERGTANPLGFEMDDELYIILVEGR